jgi:predicted XRE-type DNA-binding protein
MCQNYTAINVDSFWGRVNKTTNLKDCWNWSLSHTKDGYGQLRCGKKMVHAHRVAYEFSYGSIPNNYQVLHRCDNPSCCNPVHLFLGTQLDNIADMVHKKRNSAPRGEHNPKHKLSDKQVLEIQQYFLNTGAFQEDIAKKFEISQGQVSKILNKKIRA